MDPVQQPSLFPLFVLGIFFIFLGGEEIIGLFWAILGYASPILGYFGLFWGKKKQFYTILAHFWLFLPSRLIFLLTSAGLALFLKLGIA